MSIFIYTSSIDFISNLEFDYLETYSFQRGQEFEERRKASLLEFNRLNPKNNGAVSLTTFIEDLNSQQKLIVENGRFHPSSRKISKYILRS